MVGYQSPAWRLSRSIPELGLATTVVSMSKKLYPHCSSHPAVKLGTYCILYIRAQLKNSLWADAVLPTCLPHYLDTACISEVMKIHNQQFYQKHYYFVSQKKQQNLVLTPPTLATQIQDANLSCTCNVQVLVEQHSTKTTCFFLCSNYEEFGHKFQTIVCFHLIGYL